jgi:hypothetical protein
MCAPDLGVYAAFSPVPAATPVRLTGAGVQASIFRGLELIPSKWRCLVLPTDASATGTLYRVLTRTPTVGRL